MISEIIDKMRAARKIWIYVLIAVIAALVLLSLNGTNESVGGKTDLESRMESILSDMDGVGKARVMITQQDDGEIKGVLIATAGANRISIRLNIQNAVKTLLDIDLSKIEIVESA